MKRGLRGVTCSEARLFGSHLKAHRNITAEIGRHAEAARRGCRQCGRFWKASVPRTVKRLMFVSFVQGAAWSGLTGMTLEPRHCAYLDRVLFGMLRSLSGGAACQNVDRNQTETSKLSLSSQGTAADSWRLARAEVAMVPETGAAPERPPRGGYCCAGDVHSRGNGRGLATDERGRRLPDPHPNGKTDGH